jgi:Holliday junction resolvasome RuvABC ATP-dependent DNA helicase subunit
MAIQLQKIFFDFDSNHPEQGKRPADDDIAIMLARNNSACPLNRIIVSAKNEGNFRQLHRFASAAYRRFNRSCRGFSFGLYCPPGQGKTFIAKRFAETIGIPFVFVQSPSLKSTWQLFQLISKECEKLGTPVVPHKSKNADYVLPPVIVFFDEAHQLNLDLQKGALLNPMEPDDGYMQIVEPGGDVLTVDCKDICWIAASTDPADLFDAFRDRFLNNIEWESAGQEELKLIIKSGLEEKVKDKLLEISPPLDVCALIGKYQRVPRLAIHGFGVQVVLHKQAIPSCSWEECCDVVASDLGIDKWGLTKKQVAVLAALGNRPMARARLSNVCQCRAEQVDRMVLPALMQYGENTQPLCVSITGRGMCITEAGTVELEKRGLTHNGRKITAEYFEAKR